MERSNPTCAFLIVRCPVRGRRTRVVSWCRRGRVVVRAGPNRRPGVGRRLRLRCGLCLVRGVGGAGRFPSVPGGPKWWPWWVLRSWWWPHTAASCVELGAVGVGPGGDVVDLDAGGVGAAADGAGAGGGPFEGGALQGGGVASEVDDLVNVDAVGEHGGDEGAAVDGVVRRRRGGRGRVRRSRRRSPGSVWPRMAAVAASTRKMTLAPPHGPERPGRRVGRRFDLIAPAARVLGRSAVGVRR